MKNNTPSQVGDLVFPREDRCGQWVDTHYHAMKSMNSVPKASKREFIYTGAILACHEPNRERPMHISVDIDYGTPCFVVERFEGRYPMLRVLSATGRGDRVDGWVLESDVETMRSRL